MPPAKPLLLQGGTVVTMDPARRILEADVLIEHGRIAAVDTGLASASECTVLDCRGMHVLPGLIQAHVHLGQTLFRGLAEGRPLLPWLQQRIWPLEAALDDRVAYQSAMLGAADALLSGTTMVQEIGLVRGMEGVFEAIADSGLRAVAGKCLMDWGQGVPDGLREPTDQALAEAEAAFHRWHGAAGGRIHGALCPRFILSGSRALWEGVHALANSLPAPIHTHLLEHPDESRAVEAAVSMEQMEYLDQLGILEDDLRIAHGVQFGEHHRRVLNGRPLKLAHCPSANLKLGSGIADLLFLRSLPELAVGIGCDGAACNNDLDILEEIRLATLLQAARHAPGAYPARDALELATIEGARAVGLEHTVGSIEVGKAGDVVVLDLRGPATLAASEVDVHDRIVYGADRTTVCWVVVDGRIRVDRGKLPHLDLERLRREAALAIEDVLGRVRWPA